ncbi:MAG: glycoside hydrolase family 3 C-terminal domain-containing protein [Eubacterium sp.]|nr:glycoside hydrolase family 3 C-terminal domain-containing protein [Eubacterium sp.]
MGKWTDLLDELTLHEKLSLIHAATVFNSGGVERLGIPELRMSDGPNGVRQDFRDDCFVGIHDTTEQVTWMPSNTCLATTWNPELAEKFGEVLGEEARGRGKDVILAPGINIKRTPLCGRNFEYMSEDPVLIGELVVPLIRAIQKSDVAACVKHYALNNQEQERMTMEAVVDEKTLQELYLPAFKRACLEGGSYSIMGAYNRANGEYCCNNKHLLVDVLREQWGYDGVAISDWGGVQETDATADHGVDIEMSVTPPFNEYYLADPLEEKVNAGEIPESKIDEKIERILRMMDRLKIGDPARSQGAYNTPEHQKIVESVAEEGIVLLKNETNHLPLNPRREDGTPKKVLVVGDNAVRNNGLGGGSSEIHMLYAITPMLGLKMTRGGDVDYRYMPGYYVDDEEHLSINDEWEELSLQRAEDIREGRVNQTYSEIVAELVMFSPPVSDEEAVRRDYEERILPKQKEYREEVLADVPDYDEVIFIGGLNHAYDVEGYDKTSITLPYAQDELIEAMAKAAGDKLTVVIMCGSAVEMPWADSVHSILQLSYAGMNAGLALARVLYGDVNPSGRLPETYPLCLADTPTEKYHSHPGIYTTDDGEEIPDDRLKTMKPEDIPHGHRITEYTEKLMVGYRYYETEGIDVRFPFGYGLSYTTFAISDCGAEVSVVNEADKKDIKIEVSGILKNTGDRDGSEVIQLYIGSPEPDQPTKILKKFTKIKASAGESVSFTLKLSESDFMTFDEETNGFRIEPGVYKLYLGTSVRDIVYEASIIV